MPATLLLVNAPTSSLNVVQLSLDESAMTTTTVAGVKALLQERWRVPSGELRLLCGGKDLADAQCVGELLSARRDDDGVVLLLLLRASLRLCGGKGGFGSLLRGQKATKKTTDFSSSRDLNGRRLRHVQQDKMLEEWYAKANERAARQEQAKQEKVPLFSCVLRVCVLFFSCVRAFVALRTRSRLAICRRCCCVRVCVSPRSATPPTKRL